MHKRQLRIHFELFSSDSESLRSSTVLYASTVLDECKVVNTFSEIHAESHLKLLLSRHLNEQPMRKASQSYTYAIKLR